ncbi:MAG: hypothetical protein GX478_00195 [Erysipelotrichaceae bacterium]|jgi:hypothetical protein|nr:hypothetical protein [Erysipelotrichaceae bacterium]
MAEFEHLPENWNEMNKQEKSIWFARHCINYTREGETQGIRADAPQDVQEAYQAFISGAAK